MWQQYFTPNNLSDALQLMEQHRDRARIIAGGTDLVLDLSNGRLPPVESLVDISQIPELKKISVNGSKLSIGSGVTLTEIIQSDLIRQKAPLLVEAAREIAGPQIRNMATIGGNVVNASPAADMVPPLLVLESEVMVTKPSQMMRQVPMARFLQGNRKVDLEVSEVVTGFTFTVPDPPTLFYFRKVKPRRSMAITMINIAIFLKVEDKRIKDIRIAMGAVAPTAVRLHTMESELVGLPVEKAVEPARYFGTDQDIAPISDFRASRQYRLRVARNLLREAVTELLSNFKS
jgi:CO/xanthine dehydrogenase FAD-binding subunit